MSFCGKCKSLLIKGTPLCYNETTHKRNIIGRGTFYHGRKKHAIREFYEAALFIYFVAIGISLVYKLTIECMPQNFALINSELANEIVAGVLLFPYFAYSLRTIYELKSIVGNTLLLFRASIQYKIIAFVKEDKEEKRKAEEGVGIK